MDQFIGVPDGRSVGVQEIEFTGLVTCFFQKFPPDTLFRRLPGIQLSCRYFKGFLAKGIPVLPDQEDLIFGHKRNHGRSLRVVNLHSLPPPSITKEDLIKTG